MKYPKVEKGCIEGDCENGFGIYIDYEKKRYEGYWKDGEKHGLGKNFFETGTLLYDGEWKNGEPDGHGIVYFFDHIEYEGEWHNGYMSGLGVLYYLGSKDKKHEGEFYKKEFHGQGTLYYKNGQVAYEGEWQNDERHGQGTCYDENGQVYYKGQRKNDRQDGFGKSYYDNGKKYYKGEWENGKQHGKGVSYYKDGQTKYIGEWSNGKRHGEGIEYLANDEFDGYLPFATVIPISPDHKALFQQIKYIGLWLNDERHGEGTEYFKRDDWDKAVVPQIDANRPLPAHQRAEKYQQIKYKGQWQHGKRTDNRVELNKQCKLLELIDKYERYRCKTFVNTFEVKAFSHKLFNKLEDCNSPLLKAYIKRALPEELCNPQLMISALNDLTGEILFNNSDSKDEDECVMIGYHFITNSDHLLKAYEFMLEGRLIEEFEEKYFYLSDQKIDKEIAQMNFISGYINFIIQSLTP